MQGGWRVAGVGGRAASARLPEEGTIACSGKTERTSRGEARGQVFQLEGTAHREALGWD